MTNSIDPLQRRAPTSFDVDVQQPTIRSAGPRDRDVDALASTNLDYGQLARLDEALAGT